MNHLDQRGEISDEQNGFRKQRSCQQHIYTLLTLARGACKQKSANNKGLYLAFIDFSKAFDVTDRELLFCRLHNSGVTGPVLQLMRSVYDRTVNIIRINGEYSDELRSENSVLQGNNISPTCFSLFIDSLIKELKDCREGVQINGERIPVLAYADDIVLMSTSESGLQKLLDIAANWCKNWRMVINTGKTRSCMLGQSVAPKRIIHLP